MSYVVNYGEIETNKAITEEVKEIIESILSEEFHVSVAKDLM